MSGLETPTRYSVNSLALTHPQPDSIERDPLETAHPLSDQEFAEACGRYLPRIWRQLRAMGVIDSLLDDATQEVFLTAHGKLSTFEGRARVSTWLYSIAYRVGCNYRRKARRETGVELIEAEHRTSSRDPEQDLSDKQAAQLVQSFCDHLSEKLRDVFVLCLLEGQPATEVALILGVPDNTIYSRVRLVRDAFRKELEKVNFDHGI